MKKVSYSDACQVYAGTCSTLYVPKDQENEDFQKATSLRITQLEDQITDNFVISSITSDSFEKDLLKFPNIEHFWLSIQAYELTTALSHLALDNWRNLRVFNISANRIRNIPSEAFVNNVGKNLKLETIDFSFNLLEDISSKAFIGLTTLRSLLLDFNKITSLKNGVFEGIPNVQTLNLSYNSIASIDDGVFDLTALEYLELQNNSLTTLPTNLFAHSSSLKSLDLSSNPLANDFEKIVATAIHLRNLQLNNLPVNKVVDLEIFIDLTDLQTLSLINTNYITAAVSKSSSQLKELNLFSSNLKTDNIDEVLNDLSTLFPKLNVLFINGNINGYEKNVIQKIFPQLKTLYGADATVSFE